jgi:hypothetical protein
MKYEVFLDGIPRNVELTRSADKPSHLVATIDGRRVEADSVKISPGVYSILLGGRSLEVRAQTLADNLLLHTAGREYRVEIVDPRSWRHSRSGGIDLAGRNRFRRRWPEKLCASWLHRASRWKRAKVCWSWKP